MSFITREQFFDVLNFHKAIADLHDAFIKFFCDNEKDVAVDLVPQYISDLYIRVGRTGLNRPPQEQLDQSFVQFMSTKLYDDADLSLDPKYKQYEPKLRMACSSISAMLALAKEAQLKVTEIVSSDHAVRIVPFKPNQDSGNHKTIYCTDYDELKKTIENTLTCRYWLAEPALLYVEDPRQISLILLFAAEDIL